MANFPGGCKLKSSFPTLMTSFLSNLILTVSSLSRPLPAKFRPVTYTTAFAVPELAPKSPCGSWKVIEGLIITSSISTSGITTYSSYLDLSLFFILLTIVGGSLISTSSGFKYTRIYILLKISYQEIYRLVKPINIIDKNLYNPEVKIDDQDLKIAFLAFLFFIISIFILTSVLTFDYLTFENSFKLSILTLTNTVNSALYGMDNFNFMDLNNFTKMSLVFFMILAKIEIITVIYLIKGFIFRE